MKHGLKKPGNKNNNNNKQTRNLQFDDNDELQREIVIKRKK